MYRRYPVVGLVCLIALLAGPAFAESQLAGFRIGMSPAAIQAQLGEPHGRFLPGGTYLPMGTPVPPWAYAVQAEQLMPDQWEWVYNRPPYSVGLIVTGNGPLAAVTNIIVALWSTDKPSPKAPPIRSERGIVLGSSTFGRVLQAYGYPALLTVLQESPQSGGSRLGSVAKPGAPAAGSFTLGTGSLTGSSRRSSSRKTSALPPVSGGAAPQAAGGFSPTATLNIGGSPVTFTQNMVLDYPGIEFTLYGMKVVRIHIYG